MNLTFKNLDDLNFSRPAKMIDASETCNRFWGVLNFKARVLLKGAVSTSFQAVDNYISKPTLQAFYLYQPFLYLYACRITFPARD